MRPKDMPRPFDPDHSEIEDAPHPSCMAPDGAEPCRQYQSLQARIEALEDEKEQLQAQLAEAKRQTSAVATLLSKSESSLRELRGGYTEAIEDIEDWACYASQFFQDKHDLKGCIEKHKALLKSTEGE